jgi:AcrR family transcriptional regulator
MATEPETQRRYRGETAEERRAGRRERLVEAAIELIGTGGYRETTIREICREAGLNERYFYEAFSGREGMLAAAYDEVIARVSEAVLASLSDGEAPPEARIRAGFGAFVNALADDPRLARIQLFEVVGVSEELEQRRHAVMAMFAGQIRSVSLEIDPSLDGLPDSTTDAAANLVVGGVNELVIQWVQGRTNASRDELVDGITEVSLALIAGLSAARSGA